MKQKKIIMMNLMEAVRSKRVISCRYNNKLRELEIHAVGVGADGSELIRAYERFDEFKLFKYDKMEDIKLLNKTFYIKPQFNRKSDTAMVEILFAVD